LEDSGTITIRRQKLWEKYYVSLNLMVWQDKLQMPTIPNRCKSNGHLFYIKLNSQEVRDKLLQFLKEKEIEAKTVYEPLHLTDAGKRFGRFVGEDVHTSKESSKMLRLPLHNSMTDKDVERVCAMVSEFLK
jgi:dTDP-4-amino-4,6-dideoxygalactose transaminase